MPPSAKPECSPPPLKEEIFQWPCPLIDRLVFYEKLSFFGLFCGFKYAKNALAAGAPRNPQEELLRCSPRPLTQGRMEGGARGHAPLNMDNRIETQLPRYAYNVLAVAVINDHKQLISIAALQHFRHISTQKSVQLQGASPPNPLTRGTAPGPR